MLRRTPVALLVATVLVGAIGTEAHGAGRRPNDPNVSPNGRGFIDTEIEAPGSPGGTTGGTSSGTGGGGGTVGAGSGGGGGGPECTYTPFRGDVSEVWQQLPGFTTVDFDKGSYYTRSCDNGTLDFVWVPNGQEPAGAGGAVVPVVTPEQLAQRAYNQLAPPEPGIDVNPETGEGRFQLVRLPTWWWVDNWAAVSERTELGVVWAEVTATPVLNEFDGGDGGSGASCDHAGRPWRAGMSETSYLACYYTYTKASESYTATVTVTWDVEWVGSGGTGGALPQMQTFTSLPLTVYERQAVVINGRG